MTKFIVHIDGEDIEIDDVQTVLDDNFDEDVTVEEFSEPTELIADEPIGNEVRDEPSTEN